jgi:hypothetical protein
VYVDAPTRGGQTLYWWIYPEDAGLSTTSTGTVVLDEFGEGNFTFTLTSDAYEFRVRVSPEEDNYNPNTIGVESILINSGSPTFEGEHHLHLTTGDLTETSIFLGTDDQNVRTTTDGTIQITTPNTTNNIWEFGTDGKLTLPTAGIIRNGTGTAQVGSTRTIATDSEEGTGAGTPGVVDVPFDGTLSNTYPAGSTITFANGDVRTITSIVQGNVGLYLDISYSGTATDSSPEFPIILKTANYAAATTAPEWTFGGDGRTTFPNGTVPEHSYGAAGDKEGMVVFSDPYIYYCKQDYVDNETDIWVRVAWTGTNW